MEITDKKLGKFVGGSVTVESKKGDYLYKGTIDEAYVEGEGDRQSVVLVVEEWKKTGKGCKEIPRTYQVFMIMRNVEFKGRKILLQPKFPMTDEVITLIPPEVNADKGGML